MRRGTGAAPTQGLQRAVRRGDLGVALLSDQQNLVLRLDRRSGSRAPVPGRVSRRKTHPESLSPPGGDKEDPFRYLPGRLLTCLPYRSRVLLPRRGYCALYYKGSLFWERVRKVRLAFGKENIWFHCAVFRERKKRKITAHRRLQSKGSAHAGDTIIGKRRCGTVAAIRYSLPNLNVPAIMP